MFRSMRDYIRNKFPACESELQEEVLPPDSAVIADV